MTVEELTDDNKISLIRALKLEKGDIGRTREYLKVNSGIIFGSNAQFKEVFAEAHRMAPDQYYSKHFTGKLKHFSERKGNVPVFKKSIRVSRTEIVRE